MVSNILDGLGFGREKTDKSQTISLKKDGNPRGLHNLKINTKHLKYP